jgi:hypothetical protein
MTGRFADLVWMNGRIITEIWELGDGDAVFRTGTQNGAKVITHAHVSYGP